MQEIVRRLQNLEAFNHLAERDLKELAYYMKVLHLRNRQIVFSKDEPIKSIHLVLCGSVKILEELNGEEVKIFNFLARGEFLGVAMAGLPQPKYPTSAQCNEDCTLLEIPLSLFSQMMIQIPELRKEVNKQISQRFLEFQNDICKAHRLVPFRLANFLLRMLERQGSLSPDRIQIPMTRLDIADRIGAQSETVIRILSGWTKRGWLRTEDRHIEVLNRDALQEVQYERPHKRLETTA